MNSTAKVSFSTLRSIFFFGLIILLTIAILYILSPFVYPIFWAAIIGVMFYPFYKKLLAWFKHPRLATVATLILVVIVIFLPLSIISLLLVNESVQLYNTAVGEGGIFRSGGDVQNFSTLLNSPVLAPFVESIKSKWTLYASQITQSLSGALFNSVKNITQNSVRFVFMLFIMFYTLYYFFKDGPRILDKVRHLSPVGDTYETMLFQRFTSTARATLKSTFIIGGIQGFIGGIVFWITGIQGALVWGVIMGALSVLPALGAFMVWLPAGLITLALGNIWQGVTILLVGVFVISSVDNLLRPPLVGKDTQMHPLVVLFSTLGGLVIFGVSGFVIGPIIAALYLSIISIYHHYYQHELGNN